MRDVEDGLKRSNKRDQFVLVPKLAVRVDDLRRGLLDNSPRIVHFSGHGGGPSGIVLEDDQGKAYEVPDEALARLFELCAGQIDCVVLNACFSEVQANAIAKHIPYVIGMNASISDVAATEFAVAFYDALGAGKSIKDAFEFGKNAIALKGIPEDQTPVLIKKRLTPSEKKRLESSYAPAGDIHMDVSVLNDDASSWNRGEETVLRYIVADQDNNRIRITPNMGYLTIFNGGGPIGALEYVQSVTNCPFKWDFPLLDFKVLNNRQTSLFLTEAIFDIEESSVDTAPLLTIKRDTQQRFAGELLLVNEGGCDFANVVLSFHLVPGKIDVSPDFEPPFEHSVSLPILKDYANVNVLEAFQRAGVDIAGLISLMNGEWEEDYFVIEKADKSKEQMSEAEMEKRWKLYLGPFSDEVGTLVGEISFAKDDDQSNRQEVKFVAPVYLANRNRMGIPRPPTYSYDTAFEIERRNYQKRVQISQELQPGDADRFTIRIAAEKSSFHRFRVTLRDIGGQTISSLPMQLRCFVPRSRSKAVQQKLLASVPKL